MRYLNMGAVLFEQNTHFQSNMLLLLELLVWICFRDKIFSISFIQQSPWVPAIWASTILGLVSSNWAWIFKSPSSGMSFIQVALCVPPPLELRWGKWEQNWNAVCFAVSGLGLSVRLWAHFTIKLITWGEKLRVTDFSGTTSHCLTWKIHVWCFSV